MNVGGLRLKGVERFLLDVPAHASSLGCPGWHGLLSYESNHSNLHCLPPACIAEGYLLRELASSSRSRIPTDLQRVCTDFKDDPFQRRGWSSAWHANGQTFLLPQDVDDLRDMNTCGQRSLLVCFMRE